MKTVLVLCEAKYWHDFKTGFAATNVDFIGFDKKKPKRSELDFLVKKADFVFMRNLNVAHHSVRFAKEACKSTNKPFWISSNFGLETMIKKLNEVFPDEHFKLVNAVTNAKKSKKKVIKPTTLPSSEKVQISNKKPKNLPLKNVLKSVKFDDDIDFEKLFK